MTDEKQQPDLDLDRDVKISRCERCLLPATTPGLTLDHNGICNVCREYVSPDPMGTDALLQKVTSVPTAEKPHDCIVPISGGLDSFYTAHYLSHRLQLRCVGVHYDHGLGSVSKEPMIQWIEDNLGITIIRVAWPKEKTIRLILESVRSLLAFGPRYLQAALCRHCGYGIRAAVYGEMVKRGLHSVWGMHTMDSVPFRYCLDPGRVRPFVQPACIHAIRALRARWRQMREVPSPGASPGLLFKRGFGYPDLPQQYSHLKVLPFFNYVAWNKQSMVEELKAQGVDIVAFQKAHSDCSIAPVVDHVLRAAWSVGKAEIYVCNRVRVGQLDRQDGLDEIDVLLRESAPYDAARQLGLRDEEIDRMFNSNKGK